MSTWGREGVIKGWKIDVFQKSKSVSKILFIIIKKFLPHLNKSVLFYIYSLFLSIIEYAKGNINY